MVAASTNATGGQDTTAAFSIAVVGRRPTAVGRGATDSVVGLAGVAARPDVAGDRRMVPAQYPGSGLLLLCVILVAASGLVWAATVNLDGNVGDWSGIAPVAGNPKGSAPVDANIVEVFFQSDANNLYFRIDADVRVDVVANQPPTASAGADQTITLPATAPLAGNASDDGLPNPPGRADDDLEQGQRPGHRDVRRRACAEHDGRLLAERRLRAATDRRRRRRWARATTCRSPSTLRRTRTR